MTDGVRRCERLVVRLKGALGRLPPRELRRPRKALLAHLLCDGAIAQYPDEVAGKPCRILRISQQGSVAHHLGNRPTGMRKPATWKASCLTWWLILYKRFTHSDIMYTKVGNEDSFELIL